MIVRLLVGYKKNTPALQMVAGQEYAQLLICYYHFKMLYPVMSSD